MAGLYRKKNWNANDIGTGVLDNVSLTVHELRSFRIKQLNSYFVKVKKISLTKTAAAVAVHSIIAKVCSCTYTTFTY